MYCLTVFNYNTKENKILSCGGFNNMLEELETNAHEYILEKQGTNQEIKYSNFVYNHKEHPNRQRQQLCGPFYVEKSKYDLNKFKVKEYLKIYGYVWNEYKKINHLSFTISKDGNLFVNEFINLSFCLNDEFNKVLDEFESYNFKLDVDIKNPKKLIFEAKKSEPINISLNNLNNKL